MESTPPFDPDKQRGTYVFTLLSLQPYSDAECQSLTIDMCCQGHIFYRQSEGIDKNNIIQTTACAFITHYNVAKLRIDTTLIIFHFSIRIIRPDDLPCSVHAPD